MLKHGVFAWLLKHGVFVRLFKHGVGQVAVRACVRGDEYRLKSTLVGGAQDGERVWRVMEDEEIGRASYGRHWPIVGVCTRVRAMAMACAENDAKALEIESAFSGLCDEVCAHAEQLFMMRASSDFCVERAGRKGCAGWGR